jgi:hypothetical protein
MTPTPGQPKVTNVRISQTTEVVNGKPIPVYLYTFNVDSHGPFTITIPKDGFDAAKAKQMLADTAMRLHQSLP